MSGKEKKEDMYKGGTIFVDHASQYIWLHHQVSLNIGDTLQGKHAFENFAGDFNIKLKSYHADNMPFNAKEFQEDLDLTTMSCPSIFTTSISYVS